VPTDLLIGSFTLDGRSLLLFTFGAFYEGSDLPLLHLSGQPVDLFLLQLDAFLLFFTFLD